MRQATPRCALTSMCNVTFLKRGGRQAMKQLLEETGADGYNGDTMVLKYALRLPADVPVMQLPRCSLTTPSTLRLKLSWSRSVAVR